MLYFIKGQGTSEYQELIALKEEYRESIYLDELSNTLYFNGHSTDVKVDVVTSRSDDYVIHRTFVFTRPDGTVVRIEDAEIPDITDFTLTLHDVSDGSEASYKNGLISVKDKFIIDAISKLLGIRAEYTYWATVHHVKDTDNGDYSKTTEVTVYKNEDDQWQYDYEAYEKIYIDAATGEQTETRTIPAGSRVLTPNTRVYSDRQGNIYEISGQEEIDSVTAASITLIRKSKDFNFFDGGDRPDDQTTLDDFGGIKKGTTIAELEDITVSEVIARLLFQDASVNPQEETKSYIKFTDEYIRENGITKEDSADGIAYIEIGSPYPLLKDFETVFVPDTWQLTVDGQLVGEPQILQRWTNTSYYINDKQHRWDAHGHYDDTHPQDYWDIYPVLNEGGYMEHYDEYRIEEGDKSIYYGIIHFEGIANAKDQFGNETYIDPDTGEEVYYKKGESGEVHSTNYLCFTGEDHTTNPTYVTQDVSLIYSLAGAWRIYSNATESYNDYVTAWDSRNIEPEQTFNEEAKIASKGLAIDGRAIYLKWNSHTKHTEHFYVYLPDNIIIDKIGAAHDGANYEWSARCNVTQVYDDQGHPKKVEIVNRFDVSSLYNVYEIEKSAGITNVRLFVKSTSTNA